MTTKIRVWRSFSCNNSSSYRLVARFSDAQSASDTAAELKAFLTEHALEFDGLTENGDLPDEPTNASAALAKKYSFEWEESMFTWGDDMLVGDEPTVTAEGEVLVMYHTYCGGYPREIRKYLTARGAKEVEDQSTAAPSFSLLFRVPDDDKRARDELVQLFRAQVDEDGAVEGFVTPWGTREQWGEAAFFSDGDTVGCFAPCEPEEIASMKAWLRYRGVANPSIRLCEYGDRERFRLIAKARCKACEGDLKYLDPRVHGIENEQLACKACGGMFELGSFAEH